ncbi:MAG TPA: rhodanese-like domain-containing protein [Burkholderiales bacterium]|nr:rhodanese-like domain-containing protein [Burkholderiales bacterium]
MRQLTAAELKTWLEDPSRERPVLLDVRESWEVRICALPDSLHVPMREVPSRAGEIDPEAPVVAICHHGARSMQVAVFLERNGYSDTYNLVGGVDAWAKTVDPKMPVY